MFASANLAVFCIRERLSCCCAAKRDASLCCSVGRTTKGNNCRPNGSCLALSTIQNCRVARFSQCAQYSIVYFERAPLGCCPLYRYNRLLSDVGAEKLHRQGTGIA